MKRIQKTKCKAVPLQAWSGPQGSRKLRFRDFMTTVQDGGKFVSLTHRPPLPQEKKRSSVTRPPAHNVLGDSYHKLHYTV